MPKFKNGQVFVIMDDEDISTSIINRSTSRLKEQMPTKISGGVTKRLVETLEPVNSAFNSYQWYGVDEIGTVWEAVIED